MTLILVLVGVGSALVGLIFAPAWVILVLVFIALWWKADRRGRETKFPNQGVFEPVNWKDKY